MSDAMSLSRSKIRNRILESVVELIKQFQNSPYNFLYESDLQAILFTRLRSQIPDIFSIPRSSHGSMPAYQLGLVYSEYLSRIDVVCLDPESDYLRHPKPPKPRRYDTYIYELPVYAGIELKYRKMGDQFGFDYCLADFGKLKELPVQFPITIGFIQSGGEDEKNDFFATKPESWSIDNNITLDSLRRDELDFDNGIVVVSPNKIWFCSKK